MGMCRLQRSIVFIFRCGFERIKVPRAIGPDLQYRREIAAPIAVVGGRPHCAQQIIVEHIVALHTQLVCAENMRHAITLQEMPHDRRAKRVAGTTGRESKILLIGLALRPTKVGHSTLMRDLAEPIENFDLVDVVDRRRQAAVDAENVVVHNHR